MRIKTDVFIIICLLIRYVKLFYVFKAIFCYSVLDIIKEKEAAYVS